MAYDTPRTLDPDDSEDRLLIEGRANAGGDDLARKIHEHEEQNGRQHS